MRGIPRYFNTKEDYMNCLSLYPEETKVALRMLLNGRFTWKVQKELKSEADGVKDDNHYFYTTTQKNEKGEDEEVIYQMEKVEDKNSKFFELGFTVKEVEKILA